MSLRSGLKAPASIKANGLADQYKDMRSGAAWLWTPTNNTAISARTLIKSYVMELIASFVFCFFVVFSVVTAVNNGADMNLRTMLVALVSGASYYMVTGWLRMPEEELPRHASWSVTLARFLVLRFGLFHTLIYLVVQLVGAIIAAALLFGFGFGASVVDVWVPAFPAGGSVAHSWGAELLSSGLIIFSLLYNHMAGVETDDEQKYERKGEMAASLVRGLATFLFFRLGHFTFDSIVYLAGLFATGMAGPFLSDTAATRLSWGFFVGVPLLGAIGAVLLYWLMVFLSYHPETKYKANGGPGLARAERQIHTQYVKLAE